jgi:2-polyprenyl-6-methoxyphenol hydroxylase-like FAD-dependent oxidoreductase
MARAAYRDAIPRRWWRGRAVLVGDAAHAMSPQLGQGANMALADAVMLADVLEHAASLPEAFDRYAGMRRRHLSAYHRYSRWLTPLFQSDRDALAWLRDVAFHPFGRMPLARTHMLRVLSGTQQGWFGRHPLDPAFLAALRRTAAAG